MSIYYIFAFTHTHTWNKTATQIIGATSPVAREVRPNWASFFLSWQLLPVIIWIIDIFLYVQSRPQIQHNLFPLLRVCQILANHSVSKQISAWTQCPPNTKKINTPPETLIKWVVLFASHLWGVIHCRRVRVDVASPMMAVYHKFTFLQ